MAAESDENESITAAVRDETLHRRDASNGGDSTVSGEHDSDGEEEEDDIDDEPKLKYSRLTGNLGPVYRNGDATSSFMVAGDKMIIGTHNGNIHVLSIPSFQSLRLYNAHSASVTAVSVSPLLPPLPNNRDAVIRPVDKPEIPKHMPTAAGHTSTHRSPRQPQVPVIPSNQIHIATSSIDGNVCVSSLVDPKDITLRNFSRPVQAVALSPEYKSDRAYLSGGLAGELILTTGVQAGVRTNANTNHASAAAQGWLGAIGLGGHSGRDTILHSGEGTISMIKWSLSGEYVVWANEQGIRIMRTNIKLDSADAESAWKRIGFIDKPNRRIWEEMAIVWKARAEWVDDESLESDKDSIISMNGSSLAREKENSTLPHKRSAKHHNGTKKRKIEKLVIGWGDAAWIVHVDPGGTGVGKHVGERSVGSAEIIHHLRFEDCIVSGISLYTPSLLLVLAYRTRDDDDNPITPTDETTPRRGMHRRHNGLSPELKLIDAATSDEIEVDALTVSRFETLSAADYHLSTMYVPHPESMTQAQKSALEALSGGIWDAGVSAARILSSGASIINVPGIGDSGKTLRSVSSASVDNASASTPKRGQQVHPNAAGAGLKVFIQSPYDCVLAVKRDLTDHFNWELDHESYKDAWELLQDHPEIIANSTYSPPDASPTTTPTRRQGSLQEFFADDSASQTTESASHPNNNSSVEKEKRRIGDLWVQQLVNAGHWAEAGKVAGRVLGTSARWEYWVWKFAQANRFDEISPYIPTKQMQPPLPSLVYEVVLGHYIIHDRMRFKQLLEDWEPSLFDIDAVIEAIKSKLSAGDVTEDSVEGDEQGRDWRILQDALAKLYLAGGHQREALRCYIRLQNADAAMGMIREFHLVEAIRDDIPGFILLRVSKEQMESGSLSELEEASSEPIHLLVEEACRGIVPAREVVSQLQERGPSFQPFLFFYLRGLSEPQRIDKKTRASKGQIAADRLAANTIAEEFADLIVELFAEYDRDLFIGYLKKSQNYNLEKAAAICDNRDYIPELVLILSKTGQTKRALYLIIERLSDVSFAISFAKEQDDPDLWNDLLEYSMDKPHFIRGLLEQVGTAIDPIQLVRRIPEGLEIEGLRDGIRKMVREYEIQHSISEGVAKVLRGEVAQGMDTLRAGRKRGIKFEVIPCDDERNSHGIRMEQSAPKVELEPKSILPSLAVATNLRDDTTSRYTAVMQTETSTPSTPLQGDGPPGHCTGCHNAFTLPTPEEELIDDGTIPPSRDTLVGFACGHVFHLSCLLPKTSASASVAATLQARLAADAAEGSGYWGRSIGAKVAHAHVIKAAVGKGCVVCRERDEEGGGGEES
ncbi:hypothetical protein GQ43DRAFT_481105 [Delitschia confertaspora ATCC 74209]|uniref:Vps41 beta-propeller domain-containing protein n=1 Tax=Delitschia confertaspora ATCC 74209 TaxID=1513339 RepID=A0A9P4MYK6_9PLEO|nr:hypothetical protein GQ43DRAFT_481105 [Delitschia confertaspora ATCC 74209]